MTYPLDDYRPEDPAETRARDDIEARPTAEFSVHFIEDPEGDLLQLPVIDRLPDYPVWVHVKLAGLPVGTLVMNEVEWATLWRALQRSTPAFERTGLSLHRTGPFR